MKFICTIIFLLSATSYGKENNNLNLNAMNGKWSCEVKNKLTNSRVLLVNSEMIFNANNLTEVSKGTVTLYSVNAPQEKSILGIESQSKFKIIKDNTVSSISKTNKVWVKKDDLSVFTPDVVKGFQNQSKAKLLFKTIKPNIVHIIDIKGHHTKKCVRI